MTASLQMALDSLEPFLDHIQMRLRCRDPMRRFLLEAVKHVNCLRANGVDGSKGSYSRVFHDFENSTRPKAFQRLDTFMPSTSLRKVQRIPESVLDFIRHLLKIFPRRCDPKQRS